MREWREKIKRKREEKIAISTVLPSFILTDGNLFRKLIELVAAFQNSLSFLLERQSSYSYVYLLCSMELESLFSLFDHRRF